MVLESPTPIAAARVQAGGEPLARGVELGAAPVAAAARRAAKSASSSAARTGRDHALALDLLEGHVGVERAGGCARVVLARA